MVGVQAVAGEALGHRPREDDEVIPQIGKAGEADIAVTAPLPAQEV